MKTFVGIDLGSTTTKAVLLDEDRKVIGRGITIGRPLANLLSLKEPNANATVTVCHTGTKFLPEYTKEADIIVAAAGRPSIVTPDMVRPGAAVVSAGVTFEGRRVVPDADEACGEVAGWITPRLGGVGPTTRAMLLRQTVEAAERRAARVARVYFCDRHGGRSIRRILPERPRCVIGCGPRALRFEIHVRALMLHRLERPYRLAELLARFGVFHGHVQRALHSADHFRNHRGRRDVDCSSQSCQIA